MPLPLLSRFALLILLFFSGSGAPLVAEMTPNLIFGYGCLINSELRAKNQSGRSPAIAARISPSFGYRRCWNFCGPSYCALGLEKSSSPSSINGVVYAVDVEDMTLWDRFEEGYDRVEVPRSMIEFLGWSEPKADTKIWIYVPRSELQSHPDSNTPLMQSYLDLVLAGCLEYGTDFAVEFLENTSHWPDAWVDDRTAVKNSWADRREQKYFDKLLQSHPSDPKQNRFAGRKRQDHK